MEGTSFSFDFINTTTDYSPQEGNMEDDLEFDFVHVIIIICYGITFILGTIGNGLDIWITGFKMKKTVNILWFLNLAVADFALNIIFPLQIIWWIMEGQWPFGRIMCKIIFTVLFLNMSVSTSFLTVISVDRCILVMRPVWSKNHRTLKSASIISAVIWSSCFLLNSPYLVFFDIALDTENNNSYCIPIFAEDHHTVKMMYTAMLFTRSVLMFLIPLSIIIICYSLVTSRLRRSRGLSESSRPYKAIVTIVLCFFGFWFPFHLWFFMQYVNIEMSYFVEIIMQEIVCCLCYINSCVNPIVYVFVGRDFKRVCLSPFHFFWRAHSERSIKLIRRINMTRL